jgi:hypothetical protein
MNFYLQMTLTWTSLFILPIFHQAQLGQYAVATGPLVSPAVPTNLFSCQLILEFYSHQLCFYKPILFITWTKSFPCPVSQELQYVQQPSSSPTINRDLFPAPSLLLISNQPCFSSQILKGQTYD